MAKSKYDDLVKPRLNEIKKWLEQGLFEKDIIKNLGVGKTSFEAYKKQYSELSELLIKGRENQNEEVINSLYKNATGFHYLEEQAFKCKEVYYDENDRRCEREEVKSLMVKKFKPPETEAAKYWLKNRDKKEWADNPHMIDLRREEFEYKKKCDDDFGDWK
jgi:hypothetical protein